MKSNNHRRLTLTTRQIPRNGILSSKSLRTCSFFESEMTFCVGFPTNCLPHSLQQWFCLPLWIWQFFLVWVLSQAGQWMFTVYLLVILAISKRITIIRRCVNHIYEHYMLRTTELCENRPISPDLAKNEPWTVILWRNLRRFWDFRVAQTQVGQGFALIFIFTTQS